MTVVPRLGIEPGTPGFEIYYDHTADDDEDDDYYYNGAGDYDEQKRRSS